MNDSLKWLLLGVGGYLLYSQYAAPAASGVTATTTGTNAPSGNATPEMLTLYTIEQIGPGPVLMAAQNAGAANGGVGSTNQLLSGYQWGYFLNQVSGIPTPDLTAFLGDMSQLFPLSSYWAALLAWAQAQVVAASASSATGVSGLSGLSGVSLSGLSGHSRMRPGQQRMGQRKVQGDFPAPGNNETGRFDMADMGWA